MVKKNISNFSLLNMDKAGENVGRITDGVFKKITKPFITDKRKLTLGQRTADNLAKWAGSWTFIFTFFILLGIWMTTNGYFFLKFINNGTFTDEYPFILLNLILSCLAAIQAPVILMSQNRSAERDRLRAEYDYQINRKSEKEIREIQTQLDRIEKKLK